MRETSAVDFKLFFLLYLSFSSFSCRNIGRFVVISSSKCFILLPCRCWFSFSRCSICSLIFSTKTRRHASKQACRQTIYDGRLEEMMVGWLITHALGDMLFTSNSTYERDFSIFLAGDLGCFYQSETLLVSRTVVVVILLHMLSLLQMLCCTPRRIHHRLSWDRSAIVTTITFTSGLTSHTHNLLDLPRKLSTLLSERSLLRKWWCAAAYRSKCRLRRAWVKQHLFLILNVLLLLLRMRSLERLWWWRWWW